MATANIIINMYGEATCLTCYMYGIVGCDEHRPQWATGDTIQTVADFETVTVNGREVINVVSHKKPFQTSPGIRKLIDEMRSLGWSATGRRLDDSAHRYHNHHGPIFDLPPTAQPKHDLKPLAAEHLKRHPYMVGIDPGMPEAGFVVYNPNAERYQNHWATWKDGGSDPMMYDDFSATKRMHRPHKAIDVTMEMYPDVHERIKDLFNRNLITKEQVYGSNIDKLLGVDFHVVPEKEQHKMNRLEVIEREMKRLQRERAILARFPKDDFAEGTVIKFEKVFGSWDDLKDNDQIIKYTYVGVKINGHWYCSGSMGHQSPQAYKWADLTEWMGDGVDKVYLMTEGRLIVGEEDIAPAAEEESGTVGFFAEGPDDIEDKPAGTYMPTLKSIVDNPQA